MTPADHRSIVVLFLTRPQSVPEAVSA